jgi:threonine dehydratase
MVGGHSRQEEGEFLYRFWFPERPGALSRLLAAMGTSWNISLFHYRAQGGDFGRVLIGLELPTDQHGDLNSFLDALGYYYVEETNNPAYKRFLKGG